MIKFKIIGLVEICLKILVNIGFKFGILVWFLLLNKDNCFEYFFILIFKDGMVFNIFNNLFIVIGIILVSLLISCKEL